MKTLVSVMMLAIALAWPSAGEAQSKKRTVQTTQQKHVPSRARPSASTRNAPCERRVWWGCVGWDPDPNVRAMLARDVGGDD